MSRNKIYSGEDENWIKFGWFLNDDWMNFVLPSILDWFMNFIYLNEIVIVKILLIFVNQYYQL